MSPPDILPSAVIRNSFLDGVFATVFGTLTGGVFLTGFALYLGMGEVAIGFMAAVPYAATLFQLPTSLVITRTGRRKGITLFGAAAGRLMWLPILGGALLLAPQASGARIAWVLALLFVSHALMSASYVAWFSWTSDLVPDRLLGRFFGTRNMVNGIAGMAAIVGFGYLLDTVLRRFPDRQSYGFGLVFGTAVACGVISLWFLWRVTDAPGVHRGNAPWRAADLLRPLGRANFKAFLTYSVLWNFSVFFASPFFTLYFLRDIGFSYAFVSALGMVSVLADLTAMRLWGAVSDKVHNKAVIQACSWVAALLPLTWTFVRPGQLLFPLLLHVLGGAFWAGINLCTNNLVLRITPREERAVCFSVHNIVAGVGASAAPIAAGLAVDLLGSLDLHLLHPAITPLRLVFAASTVLRLLSLQLLKSVREPEEMPVRQVIRVLRNIRGLGTASGFQALLHPFVEAPAGEPEKGCERRNRPK